MSTRSITPVTSSDGIEALIFVIRGQRVLLDNDLAILYGVETKKLIQAVKRNLDRFPSDFMFQLADSEVTALRSQTATANTSAANSTPALRSQIVTSNNGRGGRRYLPYAFTEQGVAMLSSVLRSPQAVAVNIEIMRKLVRLRHVLATHAELARKLDTLEKKYDGQFKVVFDALRRMMSPSPRSGRRIGLK